MQKIRGIQMDQENNSDEDLGYFFAWFFTFIPIITIVYVLTNWSKPGRRKMALQAIITPLASYFIWFLLAIMFSGSDYNLKGSIGIFMICTPLAIHYFVMRYFYIL
jgi:uncharacterized membrane protein HdeD (DUF308 family)